MKSQNRKSGNEEIIKKKSPNTHIHPSISAAKWWGATTREKRKKGKKRKGLCLIGSSVVESRGLDSSATASCSLSPLLLLVQLLRLQGIHPSIHLELLLHAAAKEDVGGLNVLQKSSKEKKDDLYYDLMHTMCVCAGGDLYRRRTGSKSPPTLLY
jgi:hypothetical protein